jgi:hypothetical protein
MSSNFTVDWLALREPCDRRARNVEVLDAVAGLLADRSAPAIVDLACGTGATLRAVAPRLPARQSWSLVDNDLGLLARAAAQDVPAGLRVVARPVDLVHDLEAALDGPVDLVTSSALLDLVSAEWLERLAVETAARRLPVYVALTCDGPPQLNPVDPFDPAIVAAVGDHLRRDHGFGPALGWAAADAACAQFAAVGGRVVSGSSDWVLGADDSEIQLEILAGWAAVGRAAGAPLADVAAWLTRRRDLVAAGRSAIRIGHRDVLAVPTTTLLSDRSQSNSTSSPSG